MLYKRLKNSQNGERKKGDDDDEEVKKVQKLSLWKFIFGIFSHSSLLWLSFNTKKSPNFVTLSHEKSFFQRLIQCFSRIHFFSFPFFSTRSTGLRVILAQKFVMLQFTYSFCVICGDKLNCMMYSFTRINGNLIEFKKNSMNFHETENFNDDAQGTLIRLCKRVHLLHEHIAAVTCINFCGCGSGQTWFFVEIWHSKNLSLIQLFRLAKKWPKIMI